MHPWIVKPPNIFYGMSLALPAFKDQIMYLNPDGHFAQNNCQLRSPAVACVAFHRYEHQEFCEVFQTIKNRRNDFVAELFSATDNFLSMSFSVQHFQSGMIF